MKKKLWLRPSKVSQIWKNEAKSKQHQKMCSLSWSRHGHLRSQRHHGQLQNLSSFITKNYRKVEDLPKAKVFQNLNGEIRNQTTKEPERFYHTRKMFFPCIANQSKGKQWPSKERKKTMFRRQIKTTEENPSQTEEQNLVRIIESFARLKNRSQFLTHLKCVKLTGRNLVIHVRSSTTHSRGIKAPSLQGTTKNWRISQEHGFYQGTKGPNQKSNLKRTNYYYQPHKTTQMKTTAFKVRKT